MKRFLRTLTVPINRNTSQIIKGNKPDQTKNTSKGLFWQKYLGKPCPRRSRKFLSADLHIQMIYWLKISFFKKIPWFIHEEQQKFLVVGTCGKQP